LRILFLIRSLNIGGAERQLINLAKNLHLQGKAVSVAVFYGNGALEKELLEIHVPVFNLQKAGRWDVLPFGIRYVRLISHWKPDVIYGFLSTPNILTALLKLIFKKKIKIVWSVRASNVDLHRYDFLARASYLVECWLSKYADLIICNSAAGQDHAVKNGFPQSKTVVIHNGTDTERFKPNHEARTRIRKEWGINEHDKLIAIVARLDPMKDHPSFLLAASLLARERADVYFICIGDGSESYGLELKQQANKLGLKEKLIWAGARSDMPAVFSALDICVSSSSFGEGFSNSIAEAMACGVPCVVTDVGDSGLIVGDLGEVVPPDSPIDLCSALVVMLTKIGEDMSVAVRTSLVERFSVDGFVAKTISTIES
jgi:glycosyltransferase involved in cell wall biosynthesis